MKKIISVILTTILIITGCTKKYEIEEIIWFKISYYTSIEKKDEDANRVSIYFNENEIYIEHRNHTEKIDRHYKVNDLEILTDYINTIKSKSDKQNIKNVSGDDEVILWSIYFETDENAYSFTGFDDYPDYWDELWQVLLVVSDAESLEDFGF